eukprot:1692099-Alexandrium_andersonii.AAC.1
MPRGLEADGAQRVPASTLHPRRAASSRTARPRPPSRGIHRTERRLRQGEWPRRTRSVQPASAGLQGEP